jgi:hypothetical protein
MRGRPFVLRAFGVAIAVLSLADAAAIGQTSSSHRAANGPPRTPWGAPDLEGVWTGSTITPLERPAQLANKAVLTKEEADALEARARERNGREPEVAPGDPGTYNQIWFDPAATVVPDRRTSLIVDPPDGRIPFTSEGRELAVRAARHYGAGARDSHVDFDTGERCLTDGMPIPYWTGYNNNYQIVQTPQHVAILAEMFHDLRIIPLDGRPTIGTPQWLGESRGRWEGDVLVVETLNFADKSSYWWATSWRAARPSLRMVERFTRLDAETLDYEFTMSDPVTFTRPWTARFPLTTNQASRGVTQGRMYEYACHEGNYSLTNVLRGARARDAAAEGGHSEPPVR